MKVLALGLNYAPEKVGIAVYTTGMLEALVVKGHQVEIFSGQPYYPNWQIAEGYSRYWYCRGVENGVDVTRAPHYVPKNPSGARRMLHHVSFAATVMFPFLFRALRTRPDVVMTIAPSLIAAPVAALAARLCGARSWLHIQDFEVEAAFATQLLRDDSMMGRSARAFERAVLKNYDWVSTISPQMLLKVIDKGVSPDRAIEFRNWSKIDTIRPMQSPSAYRAEWGIATPHVALYSGNIANKQGIEILVDAARRLRDRTDLTFVICGQGPNRANLEASAAGLTNIQFHDLQPNERLNELLGLATIHLLPQVESAADLLLPSKLANMLASGRPIVATAAPGTGLWTELQGSGLTVMPGDDVALAGAITQLLDDDDARVQLAANARAAAISHWSSQQILDGFESNLRASLGS